MQAYQVVVNISINSSGANQGWNQFQNNARNAATQAALSFNNIFGANFFADLAANAVRSMASAFTTIVQDAFKASTEAESAFKGLGSVAKNFGFTEKDANEALKNLDLVKNGLLNLSDAALSLKNLIATGFSLQESVNIIKAFGDSAAFGKQAALTFGYAISSATQGIKNQNSLLVDNAGITKNISVIMAEHGFIIQDLADKYKGAAARQALYTGLLKEAKVFQGDAVKLLDTTQGKVAQLDAAWQRFLITLGDYITKSDAVKGVLSSTIALLDFLAKNTGVLFAVATGIAAITVAMIAANTTAIPRMVTGITSLVGVMTGMQAVSGSLALTIGTMTAGWLGLIAILGAVGYAVYTIVTADEKQVEVTKEMLTQQKKRQDNLVNEIGFLSNLNPEVKRNATETEKLNAIYQTLSPTTQARISLIKDETEKTRELIAEKKYLAQSNAFQLQSEGSGRVEKLASSINELTRLRDEVTRERARYEDSTGFALLEFASGETLQTSGEIQESAVKRTQKLNAQILEQEKLVRKNAESVNEFSSILGQSNAKTLLMADSTNKLSVDTNVLQKELNKVSDSQTTVGNSTTRTTSAIQQQINEYYKLVDVMDKVKGRQSIISRISAEAAEAYADQFFYNPANPYQTVTSTPKTPQEILQSRLTGNQGELIKRQQLFDKAQKDINEVLSPKEKKERKTKSDMDSLAESVKKLRFEVQSYRDLTTPAFKLRFEREELERTKRDFETILDLRRELGIQLNAPLPTTTAGLQQEIERLKTLQETKNAVDELNKTENISLLRVQRMTEVRDELRTVLREQFNAEKELVIAQKSQSLPVVDALTRSNIDYARAVRDRRNADQQLTADVITQSRLRQDRIRDEVGSQFRAYQSLRLDVLKETTQLEEDLKKSELLLRILKGDEQGIQTEIQSQIDLRQSETPKELTIIADKTTAMAKDLNKIAATYPIPNMERPNGVTVVPVGAILQGKTQSDINPPIYDTNQPTVVDGIPVPNAQGQLPDVTINGKVYKNTTGANFYVQNQQQQQQTNNNPLDTSGNTNNETVQVQTNTPSFTITELMRKNYGDAARKERIDKEIETLKNIEAINARMNAGLIDGETELREARAQTTYDRLVGDRQTWLQTKLVEDDIKDLTSGNIQYIARLQATAQLNRRTEQRATKEQIILIEDEIAHSAEMSADRIKLAYTQAKRDFLAVDEIIGRTNATLEYYNKLRSGDAGATRAEAARYDEKIAQEGLSRERELYELQRYFSTNPTDVANRAQSEADRYEIAWLKALKNVQEADIQARESMIESQVKIADAQIYHSDQANAKVLEFLAQQKSVTDIIADAKIGVIQTTYDFIDKGLEKITSKLGAVGSLIKDIISNIIKASLNKLFLKMFGLETTGVPNGGANIGQGSGGFNFGNIISSVLNPGRAAGGGSVSSVTAGVTNTPQNTGGGLAANIQNSFFGGQGKQQYQAFQRFLQQNPVLAQSISAQQTAQQNNQGAQQAAQSAAQQAAQQALQGKFTLRGFGKNLASMAPLLGATLGAGVGGQSIAGQLLGSAGGLLAGGVLSALAAGSLTGATTGGIFGSIGGFLGISAGATAGLALAAAPLLIAGAWLLGRNKLRRQEEKQRTQILVDAKGKVQALIDQVRGGSLDSASAIAQAQAIRQDYLNQVGQLKDRKTRNIAIATVREIDYMIDTLKREGNIAETAAERMKLLVPTFATGGNISYVARQGGFSRPSDENFYIAKRDDEVVLSARDIAAIGGHGVLARAGVRGVQNTSYNQSSGLNARSVSFGHNSPATSQNPNYLFVIVADDKVADDMVARAKPGTVARKMRVHTRETGLAGYAGDLLDLRN